ncbi:MAG: hypothetical protein F6K31_03000 [Symploca sp. SIO2G7]|nr:hypothetical protein [Symploca sp. SIO2G7]
MNPIELLGKPQWSYSRLSFFLGVSETEVRRWNCQTKKTRRNPSKTAQILAAVIDKHPEVVKTIANLDVPYD